MRVQHINTLYRQHIETPKMHTPECRYHRVEPPAGADPRVAFLRVAVAYGELPEVPPDWLPGPEELIAAQALYDGRVERYVGPEGWEEDNDGR